MISLNNYEEYFFRAAENDLSAAEQSDLILFLSNHPELQPELDAFKSAVLIPDVSVEFPLKSRLLQNDADYSELFVRYIENDLNKNEMQEVDRLLAGDSKLLKEFQLYQSTILKADVSVVYPDKKSLRKNQGRAIPIYVRYMAVAAVAAGLLLIAYMQGVDFFNYMNPVNTAQTEVPVVNNFDSTNDASEKSIAPPVNNAASIENESQSDNTVVIPLNEKVNKKKNHQMVAQNSVPQSSLFNSTAEYPKDEMAMLNNNVQQSINYLPRERKAHYKTSPNNEAPNVSSSKNGVELKSLAGSFGKELLKMSGRGDYLNSASAFSGTNKKSPVNLSFEGDKFKFNHKFFKKRSNNSSK